jgi:predicted DNA binding CopG/RHH family protein
MAIGKKPKSSLPKPAIDADRAAEAFISGAVREAPEVDSRKARVMIRFDPALLQRIDKAAKRRGIPRTAWINFVASRALDEEEA